MPCRRYLFVILTLLLILCLSINFYFIRLIIDSTNLKAKNVVTTRIVDKTLEKLVNPQTPENSVAIIKNVPIADQIKSAIMKEMQTLPSKYFKPSTKYRSVVDKKLLELRITKFEPTSINKTLRKWISGRELMPSFVPELGTIIELLRNSKIVKADNAKVGTQLKLLLTFDNGLQGLFKPQWYSRDTNLDGPVYHGKDRHNAEVVALHLAALLDLRRVPLVFIRKLRLKEDVQDNGTPELLSTVYKTDNNDTCFYGQCYYCTPADPICSNNGVIEGAVILWLPRQYKLLKFRNPWQRTYKEHRFAPWELQMNYCDKVKQSKTYSLQSFTRLLDLIDTAIFDFLLDNGDRHHYEVLQGNWTNPSVLLIDNGKSLGNSDVDHIDILAPLYQCCTIHKTTWDKLQVFKGGTLSYSLKKLLIHESTMANVSLLITNQHLSAIDRRLLTVFAVVEFCLKKNYPSKIIID